MKMRQKLGAGLALSVLLGGVSFMAHAKVAALGVVGGLPSLVTDTAYPVQKNVSDGKLQVAARTGMRRRSFRFSGRRTSRSAVSSNSVSHAGIKRRSARFGGRRGVGRSAIVTTNTRSLAGKNRRHFRFRGRRGRR